MSLVDLFFSSTGRISRSSWWGGVTLLFVLYFLSLFIISFLSGFISGLFPDDTVIEFILSLIFMIIFILELVAAIIITGKRLHDLNYSGLSIALLFIPIINFILLFMLAFQKGTDGPNQYGEDPCGYSNITQEEKRPEIKERNSINKKCPFCAEDIKREAIVCRYCGRDLPKASEENKDSYEKAKEGESFSFSPLPSEEDTTWKCSTCGKSNRGGRDYCWYCETRKT